MGMLLPYNPHTARLTLLINDYKYYRDMVRNLKNIDPSYRATTIYLRNALEWALNKRGVRVIHSIRELMEEEPSAVLSNFSRAVNNLNEPRFLEVRIAEKKDRSRDSEKEVEDIGKQATSF